MPRPRQPLSKLKAMGRDIVNPARFKDRREPGSVSLGEPSPHLTDMQQAAWRSFQAEIPWLAESDRALLEMVCQIRGRMLAGEEVSISMINILRQCLSAMGATPADRSRITFADNDDDDDTAQYFHS